MGTKIKNILKVLYATFFFELTCIWLRIPTVFGIGSARPICIVLDLFAINIIFMADWLELNIDSSSDLERIEKILFEKTVMKWMCRMDMHKEKKIFHISQSLFRKWLKLKECMEPCFIFCSRIWVGISIN